MVNNISKIASDKLNALWDTGATASCISVGVAKSLNLIPTGKIQIQTPNGQSFQNTYLVDLVLANGVVITNLVVCDSSIGDQNLDVLIGMDVISAGDFSISNYKGKTYFSYRIPSKKHIDFVQDDKLEMMIGPKHGKKRI